MNDTAERVIPGWSTPTHQEFFKNRIAELVAECRGTIRILILGVYHGQDICIIRNAVRDYPNTHFEVVGVDKFDDQPCDDWPEEKRGMTWEQAFGCPPPSWEEAWKNIQPLNKNMSCTLYRAMDEEFLSDANAWGEYFDMAYLDTSHDYATVRRQLKQIKPHLRCDSSIVSGDDHIERDGWGVQRAVSEGLKYYKVDNGRIWYGRRSELI